MITIRMESHDLAIITRGIKERRLRCYEFDVTVVAPDGSVAIAFWYGNGAWTAQIARGSGLPVSVRPFGGCGVMATVYAPNDSKVKVTRRARS